MTKTITLKRWKDLDSDLDRKLLLKWFTDPEVMKYMGFYRKCKDFTSPKEAKNFSKQLEGGMFFGIYLYNGKLIGQATFSHFTDSECEFGILIGEKEYWGRGIGTETTERMVDYAFNKLKNIERIILTTASKNIAGQKAYLKAGFEIIKRIQDGRMIFAEGEFVPDDTIVMAISKKQVSED